MVKRVAGAKPDPGPTRKPAIDVPRHVDGLQDEARQVCALVQRLLAGKQVLDGMTADHPDYREAVDLWDDLLLRLWDHTRKAYWRRCLLVTALGPDALALWDATMPSPDDMRAIGLDQFARFMRERDTPPQWITPEEERLVFRGFHRLYGDYATGDAINEGLRGDYLDPPPF